MPEGQPGPQAGLGEQVPAATQQAMAQFFTQLQQMVAPNVRFPSAPLPSISYASNDLLGATSPTDLKLITENKYGMKEDTSQKLRQWSNLPPLVLFSDSWCRLSASPVWPLLQTMTKLQYDNFIESLRPLDDYLSHNEVINAVNYVSAILLVSLTDVTAKKDLSRDFLNLKLGVQARWNMRSEMVLTLYVRKKMNILFKGLVDSKKIVVKVGDWDQDLYRTCEIELVGLEKHEDLGSRMKKKMTLVEHLIEEVVKKKSTVLGSDATKGELVDLKTEFLFGNLQHLPLPHSVRFEYPPLTLTTASNSTITYHGPTSSITTPPSHSTNRSNQVSSSNVANTSNIISYSPTARSNPYPSRSTSSYPPASTSQPPASTQNNNNPNRPLASSYSPHAPDLQSFPADDPSWRWDKPQGPESGNFRIDSSHAPRQPFNPAGNAPAWFGYPRWCDSPYARGIDHQMDSKNWGTDGYCPICLNFHIGVRAADCPSWLAKPSDSPLWKVQTQYGWKGNNNRVSTCLTFNLFGRCDRLSKNLACQAYHRCTGCNSPDHFARQCSKSYSLSNSNPPTEDNRPLLEYPLPQRPLTNEEPSLLTYPKTTRVPESTLRPYDSLPKNSRPTLTHPLPQRPTLNEEPRITSLPTTSCIPESINEERRTYAQTLSLNTLPEKPVSTLSKPPLKPPPSNLKNPLPLKPSLVSIPNTAETSRPNEQEDLNPIERRPTTPKRIWKTCPTTPKLSAGQAASDIVTTLDSAVFLETTSRLSTEQRSRYRHIPSSCKRGFDLGLVFPVTETFTPENYVDPELYEPMDDWIAEEYEKGRIDGPYTENEMEQALGPFRTSPLQIVPKTKKPGKPQEYRPVENLSFKVEGQNSSVNDLLDPSLFPCRWTPILDVLHRFLYDPPTTDAAGLDVASAFRHLPSRPDQRAHLCLNWRNGYWICKVAPWGLRNTSGVFGNVMDCTIDGLMEEFRDERGQPTLRIENQVDDLLLIRLDQSLTRDQIVSRFKKFGWQLSEKGFDFGRKFTHCGLEIDLDRRTVTLPEDKKTKYRTKVEELLKGAGERKIKKDELETVIGSLLYSTLCAPTRRSYLHNLFAARRAYDYNNPHQKRHLERTTIADLNLWKRWLSDPLPLSTSFDRFQRRINVRASSDASSMGIGIVIGTEYAMWRLEENWREEDENHIGVAEGWALVALLDALIKKYGDGIEGSLVVLECDNMGICYGVKKGWSRNKRQNAAIRRLDELASLSNIYLQVQYVRSEDNPADEPSRGVVPTGFTNITLDLPLPELCSSRVTSFEYIRTSPYD